VNKEGILYDYACPTAGTDGTLASVARGPANSYAVMREMKLVLFVRDDVT
jgi:hypothetical protein